VGGSEIGAGPGPDRVSAKEARKTAGGGLPASCIGASVVRRLVARRVFGERPPAWVQIADGRLRSECEVVLRRLPARERSAFVRALTVELRANRHPPHAFGLAVEAAARRAVARREAGPASGRPS